jgi:hypothetical protein
MLIPALVSLLLNTTKILHITIQLTYNNKRRFPLVEDRG